MINGYKLFCRDRNCDGGGASKTVNVEGIKKDCDIVLTEFFIKTRKWLCIGLYKPLSQNENNFLDNLFPVINKLTCQYENFMLMARFKHDY